MLRQPEHCDSGIRARERSRASLDVSHGRERVIVLANPFTLSLAFPAENLSIAILSWRVTICRCRHDHCTMCFTSGRRLDYELPGIRRAAL
jgi:hypothetical protein